MPTKMPPEVLTDDEVRRLMQACNPRVPTGLRNRALIVLLYRSGLRISEALNLYPKDLDQSSGAVRVLRGKGKARTVGVDAGALAVIEQWMEVRANYGIGRAAPLLCSLKGNGMTPGYVRRLLPRLAWKANIDKRVHAHGLRHTHAAQLRAEGVDIGVISKQLGHRSIATTARYLDHIAPYAVIEAMQRRTWTPPPEVGI